MSKFIHQGQDKKIYVKEMFNDISYRYDLFNTLSSFGIDRYWRWRLIKKFNLQPSDKLIDIATGTGDVVFSMHKKFENVLVGLDIAEKMIVLAKKKQDKRGLSSKDISFIQGDAEDLGFSNNSFNGLSISFGFRNLGDYDKGLSEFFRVLKPEGKIAILEFSKPTVKWFIPFFRFYFNKIVPILGALLSRKDAFLYLPESVDYFLNRDEVCDKMKSIGFEDVSYTNHTFGVATIYTGVKK
jgi:demethylmenaquinone methyltransferase/2-methoxy-6-polyprenyl-1,4-benzoquinol methylase